MKYKVSLHPTGLNEMEVMCDPKLKVWEREETGERSIS